MRGRSPVRTRSRAAARPSGRRSRSPGADRSRAIDVDAWPDPPPARRRPASRSRSRSRGRGRGRGRAWAPPAPRQSVQQQLQSYIDTEPLLALVVRVFFTLLRDFAALLATLTMVVAPWAWRSYYVIGLSTYSTTPELLFALWRQAMTDVVAIPFRLACCAATLPYALVGAVAIVLYSPLRQFARGVVDPSLHGQLARLLRPHSLYFGMHITPCCAVAAWLYVKATEPIMRLLLALSWRRSQVTQLVNSRPLPALEDARLVDRPGRLPIEAKRRQACIGVTAFTTAAAVFGVLIKVYTSGATILLFCYAVFALVVFVTEAATELWHRVITDAQRPNDLSNPRFVSMRHLLGLCLLDAIGLVFLIGVSALAPWRLHKLPGRLVTGASLDAAGMHRGLFRPEVTAATTQAWTDWKEMFMFVWLQTFTWVFVVPFFVACTVLVVCTVYRLPSALRRPTIGCDVPDTVYSLWGVGLLLRYSHRFLMETKEVLLDVLTLPFLLAACVAVWRIRAVLQAVFFDVYVMSSARRSMVFRQLRLSFVDLLVVVLCIIIIVTVVRALSLIRALRQFWSSDRPRSAAGLRVAAHDFLENEFVLTSLKKEWKTEKEWVDVTHEGPAPVAQPLNGCVIVLTGTMSAVRTEVMDVISQYGGVAASSVTSSTTHLIVGDGGHDTRKYRAAVMKGVQIVNEQWLYALVTAAGLVGDPAPAPAADAH